ncbi:ROK family transcriptional regulator [Labrenzia sp. PHM005]|uniref:ROK family transcriptional regulator n=1 Tax=Labrenzia sp. PHM005 TaxID=2590016 RepID=UPI00143DACEC|nr:ROK family transcriptional regulator [Labrenzia sp. PHM005]
MNDTSFSSVAFRTSGTNLKRAKLHNHRVVLEIIRTRGPVSRTEISEITSLSRQTVQNIVADMESRGVVTMQASKAVGRGHPGMKVQLKADHAFSLGFHVNRLSVVAIACDLFGQIVWQQSAVLPSGPASATAANNLVVQLTNQLRKDKPDLCEKVFGVGLAAPGPFLSEEEISEGFDATVFSEFGAPDNLAKLQTTLGLPVVIQNDASAAALGEHVYGLGQSFSSFAFVQFGMGLGSGLILNGALYSGATKNAGEVGHICVDPAGPNCTCGRRGCLEKYLSINALCERLRLEPTDHTSVAKIEALFEQRDPAILDWMSEVAPHLWKLIDVIDMMLDPEAIIIGGIIAPAFLRELLSKASPLPERPFGTGQKVERIMIGEAGVTAVALGATATAVDALYAPQISHLFLA